MLLETLTGDDDYVRGTTYDRAGRLLGTRTLGNGLVQDYTYYGWDEKATVDTAHVGQGGRLKNMTVGTLQNLTYVYDAAGNIRTITDAFAGDDQSFQYDSLHRLTSASAAGIQVGVHRVGAYSETYTYDPVTGNLLSKGATTVVNNLMMGDLSHQYDPNHPHAVKKLVQSSDNDLPVSSYIYDDNSNQTTRIVGGETYNLAYDAENRLVEVKKNNVTIAEFTFDGDGKRVKSVMDGETILFAGANYEMNLTSGAITKYYFAGASRIAMRKYTIPVSMKVEYLLGDHLGSTSLTTDSNGNKISEIRYKPWGETRYTWTDPALDPSPAYAMTRYQYTGQFSYEAEFGLYFYNARWYDSQLGRFAQADSIVPGGVQGWDRYAYGLNNPLKHTDPSGHDVCIDGNCGLRPKMDPTTYLKNSIYHQYGVTMAEDGGKTWDLSNLRLVYASLGNINRALKGRLKSMVGGATFKLAEYKLSKKSSHRTVSPVGTK